MITDTELKVKGLKVLLKELGKVEAERFIALIKKKHLIIQNGKEVYGKIKMLRS